MVCVVIKKATQRLTRRSPFIRDPNNYQQYGTTVEFPFSSHSLHPLPSPPPSTHPTQHRPLNFGLQPFLSLPVSLPPPPPPHAHAHTHTHTHAHTHARTHACTHASKQSHLGNTVLGHASNMPKPLQPSWLSCQPLCQGMILVSNALSFNAQLPHTATYCHIIILYSHACSGQPHS